MNITELRIFPPLTIARLGSSPHPLENFDLFVTDDPLGFREIRPAETLYVEGSSGTIVKAEVPKTVKFRDGERIRPLAPFLEVFARTDADALVPLSRHLLHDLGLEPGNVRWKVRVGNTKIYRRTGKDDDRVYAEISFSDHRPHPLEGRCPNFLPGKLLPLGRVQYINPDDRFPEIRLRFTPAEGKVYGASLKRMKRDGSGPEPDPVTSVAPDRVIYDPGKGWVDYADSGAPTETNPGAIYAGYDDKDRNHKSWGYLDDECDGIVSVELDVRENTLRAFARIAAGPPFFAPDGFPIRTVMDELEQALCGPEVDPAQVPVKEVVEEILRRGFETVRLMNTAVMNGNTVQGRTAVASMMPSQDANDYGRLFEPIMATSIVDNGAVLALHQAVFAALRSGTKPWFLDLLRKPEEIGDLSEVGRRKMPALMRGADGRYLTLTRRQIDAVRKAADEN